MSRLIHTLQHAALLAVGLVLALAGGALAAAGGNFILGVANNSGTAQTGLIANTTFPLHGLVVQQNGTGNGGYFISQGGSGMLGIAKSGNKYAMSGTNDGAAGTGGAIIGMGKNNVALEATSDAKPPIKIVGPTNQAPMTVNSEVVVTNLNSDETDSWDVGCPSGTTWAGGICLETTTRTAADIYNASATCQALGGGLFGRGQQWMLPNSLTLRGAHNNDDITLSASGEWSSDIWVDDTDGYLGMVAYDFFGGALLLGEDASTSHVYRCGAVPLSFDGLSIILPFGAPEGDLPAAPQSEFVPVQVNPDGTPAD